MGKFDRVELLLGSSSLNKLKNANVLLFGVGGVGGFTAESLVRCGVGAITLVDNDIVAESNINLCEGEITREELFAEVAKYILHTKNYIDYKKRKNCPLQNRNYRYRLQLRRFKVI